VHRLGLRQIQPPIKKRSQRKLPIPRQSRPFFQAPRERSLHAHRAAVTVQLNHILRRVTPRPFKRERDHLIDDASVFILHDPVRRAMTLKLNRFFFFSSFRFASARRAPPSSHRSKHPPRDRHRVRPTQPKNRNPTRTTDDGRRHTDDGIPIRRRFDVTKSASHHTVRPHPSSSLRPRASRSRRRHRRRSSADDDIRRRALDAKHRRRGRRALASNVSKVAHFFTLLETRFKQFIRVYLSINRRNHLYLKPVIHRSIST
jgi:hypothetical protein